MNFALLGDDPVVLPLIGAIGRDPKHRLVTAALAGSLETALPRLVPGFRNLRSWDAIFATAEVQLVLVCGGSEPILEAARHLVAAGRSLVIFPRADPGSTWFYELGLIRDEGRVSLIPIFPTRLTSAIDAIQGLVLAGSLGRLLYLRIDREVTSDAVGGGPPLVARQQVDNALLHDADLLRQIGGEYSRVLAVHSGSQGERLAAAGVTLSGDQLPEATWTIRGSERLPKYELVVAGEQGEVTLTGRGDPPVWTLHSSRVELPTIEQSTPDDAGERILRSIEREAITRGAGQSWTDLVRALEVVDAAKISVRRRRAIDLHFETTSERSIFKSQMTAVGCLVLSLTLFGVVFLLLIMPLFDARSRAQLEAERTGSILRLAEFKPASEQLSESGIAHADQLAARMPTAKFPVLIESGSAQDDRKLDVPRRSTVVEQLKSHGVKDADERTQTTPIVGQWYPQLLRIVRVLAFAPLAIFLVLQALILLARPATR